MPAGWTAAAIGASGALSAGASLIGSGLTAGAAKDAANLAQGQYKQTQQNLFPFFPPAYNSLNLEQAVANAGYTGGGPDYLGQAAANVPPKMTQAELEATPGYQFTQTQGQKAVQSAAAARGLGVSGASLKGAGDYATGLANKTYQDQFNIAQQRFTDMLNLNTGQQGNVTNQFNRLHQIASLGENAAAGLGNTGATLANTAGNYINQAGLAGAAGTTGVTNALTGAANNYLGYNMLNKYMTGGYSKTMEQPDPTAGMY